LLLRRARQIHQLRFNLSSSQTLSANISRRQGHFSQERLVQLICTSGLTCIQCLPLYRIRLRYCALQSCRLLKMSPWRDLPAAFQILSELIAASFSTFSSSSKQKL